MTRIRTNHYRVQQICRARAASALCGLLLLSLPPALFGHGAFASNAPASQKVDGPVVAIASTKRDFGDVFAGEELEQIFPVHNTGTKPLELAQKSTLGTRPAERGYAVRAALWRPNQQIIARTASAKPASPG